MNIFEFMEPKTGYTAQELADLMKENIKDIQTELMDQYQKGKIGMIVVRDYEFYFLPETRSISK